MPACALFRTSGLSNADPRSDLIDPTARRLADLPWTANISASDVAGRGHERQSECNGGPNG
jgi:hypothetical protein